MVIETGSLGLVAILNRMGRLHLIEMVLSEPELEGSGGIWQVDPWGREFEAVRRARVLKARLCCPLRGRVLEGVSQ